MTPLAKRPKPKPEEFKPRLWTVEEYHRAAELGLFRPDEKLELIEGEIVEKMSPQNAPHATAIQLTRRVLVIAFGPDVEIRTQLPITTLRSPICRFASPTCFRCVPLLPTTRHSHLAYRVAWRFQCKVSLDLLHK